MAPAATSPISPLPLVLADVELSRPLTPLVPPLVDAGRHARAVRLLVRLHGHPLGIVDMQMPPAGLEPAVQVGAIWARLSGAIGRHLAHDGLAPVPRLPTSGLADGEGTACTWQARLRGTTPPSATAVITTCRAGEELARTIDTALAQDYPTFDVVVVDNRPSSSGVKALLAERFPQSRQLRYVAEARPGLSRARNAGLHVTGADIVAFTDDDVLLERSWLSSLVAGFVAAGDVACVTGLILPVEVDTPAQLLLEEFGGFGKGFQRRVWDRDRHRLDHPLYPYTVGVFGSGANAAFAREVLLQMGGFDERLGAGTLARGGEDLDIYTRVVLDGHRLVYEPAALLRHAHDRRMEDLSRQIRNYGVGLTAMLTKHLVEDRRTRRALVRRLPAGLVYALSPRSQKHASKSANYPFRLTLTEFAGMAYGPLGYLRSRAAA
jgi:GT2 family glycosyltransferase